MVAARRSEPMVPAAPDRNLKDTDEFLRTLFAGAFGYLLGLALVKFGNSVILEKQIDWPGDIFEWFIYNWPPVLGYWFLAAVALLGLLVARWRPGIHWTILWLPAAWLFWQIVSGTQSINHEISHQTLLHFTTCIVCFYLGVFSLGGAKNLWPFWACILCCFGIVLITGFEQHFGGLQQTRAFFYQYYVYPNPDQPPPADLMKRMATNRIFATLFYPNTLAEVLLIITPPVLVFIWSLERVMTIAARRLLLSVVGLGALACLYWSGSKGGWLLALLLCFVAALFLPFKQQYKIALVSAVLVLGLAGFAIKYARFFQKGAPSVVARFEYWRGALQATAEKPLVGSGPGTFGITFKRLKHSDAEFSLMTHNDYLQQASDSGVPGFLAYCGIITGGLAYTYRRGGIRKDPLKLAVWLGLLGWALESLVEFGLYIPAVAWPAFALLGWLISQGANHSTEPTAAG